MPNESNESKSNTLPDNVLNLQALIPLVYALPSAVVYVILLVILWRNFKEPFYRLFALNGIVVSKPDGSLGVETYV